LNQGGTSALEIGQGTATNQTAHIDLITDTTYADYGLRVIRDGAGAPNSTSQLMHRGTGDLRINTLDAAPIAFYTSSTERMRIDSSGRLLVGTSTARTNLLDGARSASFQTEGTVPDNSTISVVRNAASIGQPSIYLGKSRGTSVNSNTIVAAEDGLGNIQFLGADGTNLIPGASIGALVDGTPGTNDMPGRLVFSTTADGAASPTEQLRISNGGTVIYNQPAPAAVDVTATLTVANLTAKIITSSTAAAVTMTLPTGTLMDGGFGGLYNNMAFEWSVINTGATNAVTVQNGASHTIVGSGTVAASNSGRFLSRRTGATTWVTYRLSS
jgi:hypothetical protein